MNGPSIRDVEAACATLRESGFPLFADLLERHGVAARASEDAKDKEIERLKEEADASAEKAAHHEQSAATAWRAVRELKVQVATLVAGQQRNGEARQQARLDMAHELAEMEPAARDAAIRRIIDRSEDKP